VCSMVSRWPARSESVLRPISSVSSAMRWLSRSLPLLLSNLSVPLNNCCLCSSWSSLEGSSVYRLPNSADLSFCRPFSLRFAESMSLEIPEALGDFEFEILWDVRLLQSHGAEDLVCFLERALSLADGGFPGFARQLGDLVQFLAEIGLYQFQFGLVAAEALRTGIGVHDGNGC
jgi:hypothetical protein